MYHYDPRIALEELNEEALLPNPVHVRDLLMRSRLEPEQAIELNREFQEYLSHFGAAQNIARLILEKLTPR